MIIVKTNYYGSIIPKEQLKLWTPLNGKSTSTGEKITDICDIHTKAKEVEKPKEEPKTNTTNTSNSSNTTNTTETTKPGTGNNTSGGGNTTTPTEPDEPTE